MGTNKIILASGSPRRKEILSNYGIEFEICISDIDEHSDAILPDEFVIELSRQKGEAARNLIDYDGIIISADTIVYNDGILGKPKDREDAHLMLKSLSGNVHQVYTGVTVIDTKNNIVFSFAEKTDVYFYELSETDILSYIDTKECDDKAGAYAIQGLGAAFVKKIDGDYNNVVGLPLSRLLYECRLRGVRLK